MVDGSGIVAQTGFIAAPTGAGISVESIRDYVDGKLKDADLRYQQRYDFSQKAFEAALAANDARLAQMNEFRGTLSDQAARVPTRVEFSSTIDALRAEWRSEIVPLREKIEEQKRTNWPLFAGIAGILFSVVSGFLVIVQLKIESQVAPTLAAIQTGASERTEIRDRMHITEATANASSVADASSRADRIQLTSRLATVESRQSQGATDRVSAQAQTELDLREIETQFRGLSAVININADRNSQIQGLLWAQVFKGQVLPALSFHPQLYR